MACAYAGKESIVRNGFSGFGTEHGILFASDLFKQGQRGTVADHRAVAESSEYQLDSEKRHFGVKRDIIASGICRAEKGGNLVRSLLHKNGDRFSVISHAGNAGSDTSCRAENLREGHRRLSVGIADLVGKPFCGLLEIFKDICHDSSTLTPLYRNRYRGFRRIHSTRKKCRRFPSICFQAW